MYYVLTKLSSPGWSKRFDIKIYAFGELYKHICRGCIDDFIEEFGKKPRCAEDLLSTSCGAEFMLEEVDAKYLAEQFHFNYEELAPQFGYETREETREFDPESNNGKLMIAVCEQIIKDYITPI